MQFLAKLAFLLAVFIASSTAIPVPGGGPTIQPGPAARAMPTPLLPCTGNQEKCLPSRAE
ncbi:hypothetical protein FKP32DRAFT_1595689 [Trametes sanguinea]|nr:hypothetical protein FKP32DRAFT_1595689 [Trametes sanguinea]